MLTETYKKKLQPFLKVYRFFFKFRVLFLTILILIAGTTATLLSIKGMVINTIKIEDTTYGSDLTYSSYGFMSDYIHYEFKEEGAEEWTREEPYKVGNYDIRGVSKNIFDKYYYGSPQKFSIVPLKYDVQEEERKSTYGEIPNFDYGLVNGDEIVELDFSYSNIGSSSANVSIKDKSYAIFNTGGEDVTDCYDLKFNDFYQVGLLERDIVLESKASFEYDGNEHSYDGIEIVGGSLFEGDTIKVQKSDSFTYYGSNYNRPTIRFVNSDGIDVSHLYDYSYSNSSRVEIKKRPITIKTNDYSKEYDGEIDYFTVNYSISEGSLVDGDKIQLIAPQYYKVGNYQNKPSIIITNSQGINITNSYNVTFDAGNYNILPRKVKFRIEGIDREYDGYSDSFRVELIQGSLLPGHVDVLSYGSNAGYIASIHAGYHENLLDILIYDETEWKDISYNYEITIENIGHTVTKKPITVTTPQIIAPYTGNYQSFTDFEITKGELAETDKISTVQGIKVRDIGRYLNEIKIKISHEGNFETTTDYNITYDYGYINIVEETEDEEGGCGDSGSIIIPIVENSNESYSFGSSDNGVGGGSIDEAFLIAKYTSNQIHDSILLKGTSYGNYSNGTLELAPTYTRQYEINPNKFLPELLKNTARELSGKLEYVAVRTPRSYDFVYPYPILNNEQESENYTVVSDLTTNAINIKGYDFNFVDDYEVLDKLSFSDMNYRNEELSYREFVYDNYLYVDGSSTSVLDSVISDYALEGQNLIDSITRILNFYENNFLYNALDIPSATAPDPILDFLQNNHIGKCDYFAQGATILLRRMGYPTRMIGGVAAKGTTSTLELLNTNLHAQAEVYVDGKGWCSVEFTVAPIDPNFDGMTSLGDGSGLLESKALVISSESKSFVFDNQTHSYEEYSLEGTLLDGHTLDVIFNSEIRYAGTRNNNFSYTIKDENGQFVSDLYKVSVVFGELKVIARPCSVKTHNETVSLSEVSEHYAINDKEGFIGGEKIYVDNSPLRSITKPGTYKNMIIIKNIKDENGISIISSYDIIYEYGTLTVTN